MRHGLPEVERFWRNVDEDGPIPEARPDLGQCWVWTAQTLKGYGMFRANDGRIHAHRWAYVWKYGPVEPFHEVDHLCFNTVCVRPSHLEAVTHAVNIQRQRQVVNRAACPRGHPYDEANTYLRPEGGRGCRACRLEASRKYQRKGG